MGQGDEVNTSDMSPLYYVIAALLISICYISFSLFCWVSYNQKYQQKIVNLRRQKQRSEQDHNQIVSHIPLSARSGKSKQSANIFSLSPTTNRSGIKAPTSNHSNPSRENSWNEDEEEFKEVDYETGGGQHIEEEEEEEEVYLVEEAVQMDG